MIRKQIYIKPEHEAALKAQSCRAGLTEAELIRQAIENHFQAGAVRGCDRQAWEKEKEFIRQRMHQGGGTVKKHAWRREDLYGR